MNVRTAVFVAAWSLLAAPASAGVGETYGTRDPASCASRAEPKSGAPSLEQAMQYLPCDMEHAASGNIYLLSDLKLQVAPKGRAFNPITDTTQAIDPEKKVYDIRGGMRWWQCPSKHSLGWDNHPGHACNYEDMSNLSGFCYQDTFADWHCALSYSPNFRNRVRDAAPPP
jgi:hypothetical protein